MAQMTLSRRQFLGGLVTIGSTILLGQLFSRVGALKNGSVVNRYSNAQLSGSTKKWGMLIDLMRCNGCKACTRACNLAHNVPEGQEWIKCFILQENPMSGEHWFVRPCMNCQNAPCIKVCPVGASYYNEEGVVLIDNELCIGCRFCMAACPYGARYFNWGEPEQAANNPDSESTPEFANIHIKGTVEKCDYCVHFARDGTLPPCVVACPTKAIYYGDFAENAVSNADETIPLIETLERKFGYRFKEELGTEPRVYYLPPRRD